MTYCNGYYFEDNRTFVVNSKGDSIDFCDEVSIIETTIDKKSKVCKVRVSIKKSNEEETITELLDRSYLLSKPIGTLLRYGLTIAALPEYEITLAEILMDTEKNASKRIIYDELGFVDETEDTVFFANDLETPDENKCFVYVDENAIKHTGTIDTWKAGVIPVVKDNPSVFLAIAMGATAPIATLLEENGVNEDTLIWAIVGLSSTGKTTVLKASSSVWGLPTRKGLISSFLGTENFFFKSLSSRKGFPMFYDEYSVFGKKDISSMLYQISMSREGGKCKRDGSVKEVRTWSGAMICTGEKSLLKQTNGNGGLFARVIEFNVKWFSDASTAEQLVKHISRNYGTAYKPFIELLGTYSNEELEDEYANRVLELKKSIDVHTGVEERILKKLAILLLAVDMLDACWEVGIDRKRIIEVICEVYTHNAPVSDRIDACYNSLKQYIVAHRDIFPDKQKDRDYAGFEKKKGEISVFRDRKCVWILSDFFEEFLDEFGIDSSRETLHEMKVRNMIAYFGDRYKKTHNIDSIDVSCVCLYLDRNPSMKVKKVTKSRKVNEDLLKDDD